MASISDLNEQERDIKSRISSLKRQLRDKEITSKDYKKALGDSNEKLKRISDEKARLIGGGLPPMPPPPKPDSSGGSLSLDAIKQSILRERKAYPTPSPPRPSGSADSKIPSERKPAEKKTAAKEVRPPVVKEKAKEVRPPVVKERIKEVKVPVIKKVKVPVIKEVKVPVIKERIKEVKVPVIKERIKEVKVPVIKERIKEVKVPATDPEIAKMIKSSFKEIVEMNLELSKNKQNISQLIKDMRSTKELQEDVARHDREIGQSADGAREMKARLNDIEAVVDSLNNRMKSIDFQSLMQEISSQFEKMNSSLKESEKRTDDLVEKVNVDIMTLKGQIEEAKQAKEHVENLDISNIRRDMEALKQKSQYIEQHIERVDIKPMLDMIKDVERKVSTLQASSALIIE